MGASNTNYTPQGERLLDTGRLFESGRSLDHLRYFRVSRETHPLEEGSCHATTRLMDEGPTDKVTPEETGCC